MFHSSILHLLHEMICYLMSTFTLLKLFNLFINFGVYVRLGKGGIKAPPLNLNDPARKAAREADRRNFQDVKVIQM